MRNARKSPPVRALISTLKKTPVYDLLKRSPVYEAVQRERAIRAFKSWSQDDQEMLAFYSQFVRPGDVCFDVGANVGNRTKIFLRLGAQVVAVEPQESCNRVLRRAGKSNDRLHLVEKAVGDQEGKAKLHVSTANVLSTLSGDWMAATQATGRFAGYSWSKEVEVDVTTLDKLIAEYGRPTFMKIDVEGFELEVLRGLSQPVPALSLEFCPEYLAKTFACLEHCEKLGPVVCNYSVGETMSMALPEWISVDRLREVLRADKLPKRMFGDIYVRSA